ncbi:anthranilate synthase / indole-3-glycerol phosphate synthase [Linderina macrospora]|uniref:Anthranilate synthase / indole-3-glycerol phosphate synthase n=1 Tax=Linderina macrospora TaxID=4868 RepID=A0ACC1J671_9FUNG|nr:anthranilate synthase / indole-3-glycerol phosphate synthase [Linderina macrospora]
MRDPDDMAHLYTGLTTVHAQPQPSSDILATIFAKRQEDVAAQKALPGRSPADLQALLSLSVAPEPLDFVARLQSPTMAVLAEVKRASPSKGDIAANAAVEYAQAGAAAISVLTEPHWFKGSIDDLRDVRLAVGALENRPAVLRKDFIFDKYQIAEARLAGADSVLLIVKMLSKAQLKSLLAYSRELAMEPLVEVNNAEEMAVATEVGAKVVGVNNRNLRTFDVDIGNTKQLADKVAPGTVLVALSGIATPADASIYANTGVGAVLVGEALMRTDDKQAFISGLQQI